MHPKPQIKFANLKHSGPQVGRVGAVANGNGMSKPPVTTRQEKHESYGKRISERSNQDASYSSNSSNVKKDETLVKTQHSESNYESESGRSCSYKLSDFDKFKQNLFQEARQYLQSF